MERDVGDGQSQLQTRWRGATIASFTLGETLMRHQGMPCQWMSFLDPRRRFADTNGDCCTDFGLLTDTLRDRLMTQTCSRLVRCALLPCFLLLAGFTLRAETNPRFYAVEVSAIVQAAPAQITLQWAADPYATGYIVSRKAAGATS